MKREYIKKVAINMVAKSGLINLSRKGLCDAVCIPDGSFTNIMGCTFSEFIEKLKLENVATDIDVCKKVIKTRTDPELRKDQILNVIVNMAHKTGYIELTRNDIANKAGVSVGLITKYFGTMKQLRRTIIRTAIKQESIEIIAQGLANNDTHAKKAPAELKTKAAILIATR